MDTLKINNKTVRFHHAPWYFPGSIDVIVGGVGGIGSYLSFYLARQEVNLYLYDYDVIDETNMGGQLYNINQIGKSKTEAIKETIISSCGEESKVEIMGKYTDSSISNNIVFSCFDNMTARKLMFEKWEDLVKQNNWTNFDAIFIDGRLLAEEGQVFFVTPDKIEEYRKTLFNDDEVFPENCNYKSTSHCGAMISSLMISGFNNFIVNSKVKKKIRSVPFSINYQLSILNFEIQ